MKTTGLLHTLFLRCCYFSGIEKAHSDVNTSIVCVCARSVKLRWPHNIKRHEKEKKIARTIPEEAKLQINKPNKSTNEDLFLLRAQQYQISHEETERPKYRNGYHPLYIATSFQFRTTLKRVCETLLLGVCSIFHVHVFLVCGIWLRLCRFYCRYISLSPSRPVSIPMRKR